jgi:hypothetical protein
MDIHNEFIAQEKPLIFYAGKPIINRVHSFYDSDRNPWDLSDAEGFTFQVWEEREGGLLVIDWDDDNLSNSGHQVILNAPEGDTDIQRGRYYYEINAILSGGYALLLGYGLAKFI